MTTHGIRLTNLPEWWKLDNGEIEFADGVVCGSLQEYVDDRIRLIQEWDKRFDAKIEADRVLNDLDFYLKECAASNAPLAERQRPTAPQVQEQQPPTQKTSFKPSLGFLVRTDKQVWHQSNNNPANWYLIDDDLTFYCAYRTKRDSYSGVWTPLGQNSQFLDIPKNRVKDFTLAEAKAELMSKQIENSFRKELKCARNLNYQTHILGDSHDTI